MSESGEETEIFRAQVSSRMRMVRKASDVTQAETAETCGVSLRSYKDYELGRRSVPLEVLARFCETFKVSAEALLFGSRATSTSAAAGDEALVAQIAQGILAVFTPGASGDEIEKKVRLVCYAWESARAKGRDLADELREVSALTR